LLNSKFNTLEYGAAAPGAPPVFLDDERFKEMWNTQNRYYLVASQQGADRIEKLTGEEHFERVAASGGKVLLINVPANDPSTTAELGARTQKAANALDASSIGNPAGNHVPH
jgi:hypothetical protein